MTNKKQNGKDDNRLLPAFRKPNPYQLVWYKQGWSKTRTEKNNAKYWQFEIEHNGLRLP